MSAEIDREIAEPENDLAADDELEGVTGPDTQDLTQGETPAQRKADDETDAPEQAGGAGPRS